MSFPAMSSAAWLAMVGLVGSAIDAPRVLVWPQNAPAEVQDEAIVEDAGFEAVSFAEHAAALEAARAKLREDDRVALADVQERLAAAQSLYLEQDFAQMDTELAAAERHRLATLALPDACDALWEVEFQRGLAALGRSDVTTARTRFRLAAALRPDRRPEASFYGPDVAQVYVESAQAQRAAVGAPVALSVTPPDAFLVVDCQPAGNADPVLSDGLHVVWAVAPGHRPNAVIIDVGEGSSHPIGLTPDPAARGVGGLAVLPMGTSVRIEDPSARPVVLQAAAEQNADALVWLRRSSDAWEAQLHVQEGQGRVHRGAARAVVVRAALAELGPDGSIIMAPPVVATPNVSASEPVTAAARRPLARRWWVWAIVGGVALTATAVGLGVGLRPEPAAARRTIVVE